MLDVFMYDNNYNNYKYFKPENSVGYFLDEIN